ncbi:hypothetical protein XENOCAPTIV_025411, partial [Xenoophorus captivus]
CSQWRLQAELLVDVAQAFDGKVELSMPELDSKQTFHMRFLQGRLNYNFTLNINQVLKAILFRLLDLNQVFKVFFRTVELVQEPVVGSPGLSFYFRVNGRQVFLKGSNWIPAHSFQDQVTPARSVSFKRPCTVWQDFMFACAMYPTEDDFIQTVSEEVAQQKDPSRPFLVSSPTNGAESEQEGWVAENPYDPRYGDVHFYSYVLDCWDWKTFPRTRFASEYGFQSWPSFSTLQSVT